jgi:hypothetical protein
LKLPPRRRVCRPAVSRSSDEEAWVRGRDAVGGCLCLTTETREGREA